MTVVTVRPADVEFTVIAGETVFQAARRQGLTWPTICGGLGRCTVCHMLVLDGGEWLAPVNDVEAERLRSLGRVADLRGPWRLACQASIVALGGADGDSLAAVDGAGAGDLTGVRRRLVVEKIGVRYRKHAERGAG